MRAQRAVLGTWITSATSIGGAYLGWLEGLVGVETAAGLGLFGVLGGWRWGLGRWVKAKGKFWQDWTRVEAGLEEDLKVSVLIFIVLWQRVDVRSLMSLSASCISILHLTL